MRIIYLIFTLGGALALLPYINFMLWQEWYRIRRSDADYRYYKRIITKGNIIK